jgi:hypothetical protein
VLIDRAETCSTCGTRDAEWGERDAQGVLKHFPTTPYVAKTHECPGCKVAETRVRNEKNGLAPGVTVRLERRREV